MADTEKATTAGEGRRSWLGPLLGRAVLCLLLWIALTEADPGAVLPGVVVAAVAALLSYRLAPPRHRVRWQRLPGLVLRTGASAVGGGFDIALRALGLRRQLDPALLREARGAELAVQVPLAYVVSAVPGTMAIDLEDDAVLFHVLDAKQSNREHIKQAETRLRQLLRLEEDVGGG